MAWQNKGMRRPSSVEFLANSLSLFYNWIRREQTAYGPKRFGGLDEISAILYIDAIRFIPISRYGSNQSAAEARSHHPLAGTQGWRFRSFRSRHRWAQTFPYR